MVYHIYVVNDGIAILDYSVSDFRDDNVSKSAAGRLNKLLHWQDMMMFKEQGYTTYDWGNISGRKPEEMNGIDVFKAGFGGKPTKQVSIFAGNSILGSIAVMARKILNKG